MKIVKLVIDSKLFVGVQGKADSGTHDIEPHGDFYLLHHRASGKVYRIHGSQAVAEVEMPAGDEEDDDAGAPEQPATPLRRRGRPPANPA